MGTKYATIVLAEDEAGSATIQFSIGDTALPAGEAAQFDPASAAHLMGAYFTKQLDMLMVTANELKKQGLLEQYVSGVSGGNVEPTTVAGDPETPQGG